VLFIGHRKYFLICSLLIFQFSVVFGGLKIYPPKMLIKAPFRSSTITVMNNSPDREEEIWVEFKYGYQTIGENGKYRILYPSTDENNNSAAQWLRAYPQRFILPANGVQVVRIIAAPPANLSDGEYWARVVIAGTKVKPNVQLQKSPTAIRSNLEMVEKTDVPLHYRKGRLATGLVIRGVNTEIKNDSLKVSVDLSRIGNSSYWGNVSCRLKNNAGKIVSNIKDGVAIYGAIAFPLNLKIGNVPTGTYNLELNFVTEGSNLPLDYLVKTDPIIYSATVEIP